MFFALLCSQKRIIMNQKSRKILNHGSYLDILYPIQSDGLKGHKIDPVTAVRVIMHNGNNKVLGYTPQN